MKKAFHQKYLRVLRGIAKKMGYTTETATVRSNKGGVAVLGEVMLHTDTFYVCVGGSYWDSISTPGSATFFFRSCVGREDYTGGRNRQLPLAALTSDVEKVIVAFNEASAASGKEPRY